MGNVLFTPRYTYIEKISILLRNVSFWEDENFFSAMSISYLHSELARISTDKHGEAQINTEFVLIRAIFQHLKS